MSAQEWTSPEHVHRYLHRADEFRAARAPMAIHHLEHDEALTRGLERDVGKIEADPAKVRALALKQGKQGDLYADPSDRLLDVETQLGYLPETASEDVDCCQQRLEMALLIGIKPGERA